MVRFNAFFRATGACALSFLIAACFDKTTEVREESTEAAPVAATLPRVTGAISRSNTTFLVSFSEAMGPSALNPGNYSVRQESGTGQAGTLDLVSAAFDGSANTAVLVTTRSQSDVTYRVTVTNVLDAAGDPLAPAGGDAGDTRSATFAGTAPRLDDLTDSDGDGLHDGEEQRGWAAMILLASGEGVTWLVSSDPTMADSDGDGLSDEVEKRINSDPRDTDTDGDGLSDYQEHREILSSAVRQDTDDDGLMDGREFDELLTSPVQKDTDGDQLADGEEILLARRNARAADVPLPTIEIGSVDLRLDVRFTATSSQGTRELETQSVASTLQQTQNESFSNTSGTSQEMTAKATFEAGYKAGGTDSGASFKGTVEAGYTGEWTSSFTNTSSNETQKTVARTYSTDEEVTQQETVQREVVRASMRVPLSIKSLGSIAFTIENLQVTAFVQDPRDPGRLVPVATLVPDTSAGAPNRFNLGPLVPERGPFLFTNDQIFPSLVEDLMVDPRGLIFKVSNFDIVDELGRNFAFSSQDIVDRTAPLAIDYGGADSNGDSQGDATDRYHVATSSGRVVADTNGDGRIDASDRRVAFDAQGRAVGITMREALERIVGLRHFDEDTHPQGTLSAGEITTSFSTRVINGSRVLWRIRDVAREQGNSLRQWEILTTEGIAPRSTDFLNLVLEPQSGITLAHVQDLDDDRIPASWEYIHGCSDQSADSDRDGLADGAEVFSGWVVTVAGKPPVRSFSSCARTDTDRDGLSDALEANRLAGANAAPTDARRSDTDEDGVSDAAEINGYIIETRVPTLDANSSCSSFDDGSARVLIRCTSDPLDPDSDNDTLADGGEVTLGTDPTVDDGDRVFDDDGDGLSNFDEVSGWTVAYRRVSTVALEEGTLVTCTPGVDSVAECDGQNEPTSDPNDPDTDNDGIGDAQERSDGLHPRRADTDGDGRADRLELQVTNANCNGDPISAQTEVLDADTDNDLLADAAEINAWSNNSWVIRVAGQAPYVACPNPTTADPDLDLMVDGEERALQSNGQSAPTDPNLADTDDDGFSDTREAAPNRPTDPLAADQWVNFRYTQIDTLDTCELFADTIGEFYGILSLQRGGVVDDLFELRDGAFNVMSLAAGQTVTVNQSRSYVLRPSDQVRAVTREFYECDSAFCATVTSVDDDLTEGDQTYTFPVANEVRTFAHQCSGTTALQTTLVVTELQ